MVLLETELDTTGQADHSIELGNLLAPGLYLLDAEQPGGSSPVKFRID